MYNHWYDISCSTLYHWASEMCTVHRNRTQSGRYIMNCTVHRNRTQSGGYIRKVYCAQQQHLPQCALEMYTVHRNNTYQTVIRNV